MEQRLDLVEFIYNNNDTRTFIEENEITKEYVKFNPSPFLCYINASEDNVKCALQINGNDVEFVFLHNENTGSGNVIFNNITTKENFFELSNFTFNGTPGRENARMILNKYFQEPENINCFITGPAGVGKTRLILTIAYKFYKAKSSKIALLNWPDFISEYRDFENRDTSLLKTFKEVDVLLIDNLGNENASEFSVQTLSQIVSYRHLNRLQTVFTSQLQIEQYGELLTSSNKGINNSGAFSMVNKMNQNCLRIDLTN